MAIQSLELTLKIMVYRVIRNTCTFLALSSYPVKKLIFDNISYMKARTYFYHILNLIFSVKYLNFFFVIEAIHNCLHKQAVDNNTKTIYVHSLSSKF